MGAAWSNFVRSSKLASRDDASRGCGANGRRTMDMLVDEAPNVLKFDMDGKEEAEADELLLLSPLEMVFLRGVATCRNFCLM